MPNRSSLDKLDYNELLKLGIKHLLKRMKTGGTPQEVKDKIAVTLLSKAIPQSVALEHAGAIQHTLNLADYGISDAATERFAEDLLKGRFNAKNTKTA